MCFYVEFLILPCSPVVTLRSTKNWVYIPLKEISDANKLFCARCSGYRVAPKTKLWVTLLTIAKFVFPLPGLHRAAGTDLPLLRLRGASLGAARTGKGALRRTRGAARLRLSEENLNHPVGKPLCSISWKILLLASLTLWVCWRDGVDPDFFNVHMQLLCWIVLLLCTKGRFNVVIWWDTLHLFEFWRLLYSNPALFGYLLQ